MKLHMMTWNCDLYKENPDLINWTRYNSIKNIIKGRLELENSIVVLQEIPYKSNVTWEIHPIYKKLLVDFPKEKYKILHTISEKNQIMMTIIIFKKDDFEEMNESENNNRIVFCRKEEITFIGAHMPTNFKMKKGDNDKQKKEKEWKAGVWNKLIEFARLQKITNKKMIILGDFNAFIGCEDTLTESKFIDLHRCATDIIPDNIPTYVGGTSIDHIFVNFGIESKYQYHIGNDDYKLSDHKYIALDMEV